MTTRRSKTILVVVFLTVFILISIYTIIYTPVGTILSDMTPSKKKEYKQIKQKMQKIEIGMTREDVNKIMDSPQYIRKYEHFEVWYYPDYLAASEPSSCHFDINTGRVVYVVNDEYQIGTLNPKSHPFK